MRYKHFKKNPWISLLSIYLCHNKNELELCEVHYINNYAKANDNLLNVKTNQVKGRKARNNVTFKCKIMAEEILLKKMKINDHHGVLQVKCKIGDKKFRVQKRCNDNNKDKVVMFMVDKRNHIAKELIDVGAWIEYDVDMK